MARYLITRRDDVAPRCETQETAYWSLSWVRTFDDAPGGGPIEIFDSAAGAPISVAEFTRRAQRELDELGVDERL